MGNSIGDCNICCRNTYIIKNSEHDLDTFKKEAIKSKSRKKKLKDSEDESIKFKLGKELIDKQLNNSSKLNASSSRLEIKDKIKILEDLINTKNCLELTIKVLTSSPELPKGTLIKLDCQGIKTIQNTRKDGITYFGSSDINTQYIIDYFIPIAENDNDKTGSYFQIEFKIDKSAYFIRDLAIGYGTFIRLDRFMILKDNHLIGIGETFLVVNIIEKGEDNSQISQMNMSGILNTTKSSHLKIKVFGVLNNGETFYFPPMAKNINIGRYNNADIRLNDKLLSKIHCEVSYTDKDGWILSDGHENKPSTNGTWIYLNDDMMIYDKMIFKSSQTIFQCYLDNTPEE